MSAHSSLVPMYPGGWRRLFRFMQQEKSELKKERAAKRAVTTRRSKAKRGEKKERLKNCAKFSATYPPHDQRILCGERGSCHFTSGRNDNRTISEKYVKERKSIEKYTKYDLAKRKSSGSYCRLKRPRRNFPFPFQRHVLGHPKLTFHRK